VTFALELKVDIRKIEQANATAGLLVRRAIVSTLTLAGRRIERRAKRDGFGGYIDRSGALRASIRARAVKTKGNKSSSVRITAGGASPRGRVRYAAFVHDGTRGPYEIKPKAKRGRRALAWAANDGRGGLVFRRRVMHPGIKPRKFLEKAAELELPQIRRDLEQLVEAALLRAGWSDD
jgi:hypothetical protein